MRRNILPAMLVEHLLLLICLLLLCWLPICNSAYTYTLKKDVFSINITELELFPHQVRYYNHSVMMANGTYNNITVLRDFIEFNNNTKQGIAVDDRLNYQFKSRAKVKVEGNGVPYYEPLLGGHFKVMVVVDTDSPLSINQTNTSIAGESKCIMVGERRENIIKAIEKISLTPYLNSTFVNMSSSQVERVQLSTLFSVNTSIIGDSLSRSNFTTEYTFEFLSTDVNPYHPTVQVRNLYDFQIITDGCTRIRGAADFNDVSRWDVVDDSNSASLQHAQFLGSIVGEGTQINITDILQGTIEPDTALYGVGVSPRTKILSLVSGTSGGRGIYHLSNLATYEYNEVETGVVQNIYSSGYYPDFNDTGADSVIFPQNASTVLSLENDATIVSLNMSDGTLDAADSQCPKGWTISTITTDTGKSYKCFKLYENTTDYESASNTCRGSGFGSIGARLALISDHDELRLVQGLCRGDESSNARKYGCWIGMHDVIGNGTFRWEQHEHFPQISTDSGRSSYSLSFYDWKRFSRTNISVATTGQNIEEAKRCVHIAPWQDDPLVQEQGSFMDVGCFLPKAYVCQLHALTERHALNVATATIDGLSELDGGDLVVTQQATINSLRLMRSARVTVAASSSSNSIQRLELEDASALLAEQDFDFRVPVNPNSTTLIGSGEPHLRTGGGQPTVYIASEKTMTISDAPTFTPSTMIIDAKLQLDGKVDAGENVSLYLRQGGDMSRGTLDINASSAVYLDGYAFRLSSYDAFDLRLSHRSAFLGEYTGDASTEPPISGGYGPGAPIRYGVYRLGVTVSESATAEDTACIPYNATADEVAERLNAVTAISQRGNVTVRRTGSSYDPLDGFGYLYRIELDSTPTHHFQNRRVEIYLAGYGPHVNCTETAVSLLDPTGMRTCALEGRSSKIREKSCVIPPDISIKRISELAYTKSVSSHGRLIVSNGNHRMPPISTLTIGSTNGRAIAGADRLDWRAISISNYGSLTITGKGWSSWDATRLLYAPEDTEGRAWDGLAEVNGVFMTISTHMYMANRTSNFLVSSPGSIILVQGSQNSWNGGIMRGVGQMVINQSLSVGGSFKSLQDLFTLNIEAGATMNVTSGNISMSNGAVLNVEGAMVVMQNDTRSNRVYIGQSNIFGVNVSALQEDEPLTDLLRIYPSRNWAGYYDKTIPLKEAGGWYPNPECKGVRCLEQPTINIKGMGTVVVEDYANITFIAPVNFQDNSTLVIRTNAYTEFLSGGACGGSVVLNIGQASRYELTGGNFLMSKTCQIQGDGELTSVAGEHTLASLIQAHITIKGGVLLWPMYNMENGTGGTITFENGLLMSETGRMRLEPWSTIVEVKGEVEFRDNCEVQFPVIGTAAQPFLSDDFPRALDTSPRGALIAKNKMIFKGGVLQGKADFICEETMELREHYDAENRTTGVKKIMNLAKLVNKGLAVWYSGDILMENTADMLNEGKFILNDANTFDANNFYAGIVLAKEQGGDMFALNYNSYDLDQGSLDYNEYVGKRADFVTVPPSSTFIDDLACTNYLEFCSSEQMCEQFKEKCNTTSTSS